MRYNQYSHVFVYKPLMYNHDMLGKFGDGSTNSPFHRIFWFLFEKSIKSENKKKCSVLDFFLNQMIAVEFVW